MKSWSGLARLLPVSQQLGINTINRQCQMLVSSVSERIQCSCPRSSWLQHVRFVRFERLESKKPVVPQRVPIIVENVLPRIVELTPDQVSGVIVLNKSDIDDEIVMQLKKLEFTSALEILQFVETIDLKAGHSRAITVICRLLFHHIKSQELSEKNLREIAVSAGMTKFNKLVKHNCRTFDSDTLISICKLYLMLKIPTTYEVFRMVLLLLSKHTNTMDLSGMMYLYYMLNRIPSELSSPMIQAIKICISRAFEIHYQMQRDNRDFAELCKSFRFSITASCSDEFVKRLSESILLQHQSLNTRQAMEIILDLANAPVFVPDKKLILEKCFRILSRNHNGINLDSLVATLKRCARQVYLGDPSFCNHDFVDCVVERIIISGQEEIILGTAKTLNSLNHVSLELLDTCAQLIVKDPLKALSSSRFYSMVKAFSNANYKPLGWDTLQLSFLQHVPRSSNFHKLVTLASDLLALDVLPDKLIEEIFGEENISALEECFKRTGPLTLLQIYNTLKFLYPSYGGPVPSDNLLKEWRECQTIQLQQHYDLEFRQALIYMFGEDSLLMGLDHEGVFIDYCILVANQDSPPVPFFKDSQNLDTIKIPAGYSLVLLKVFNAQEYSGNNHRLSAFRELQKKIIGTFGYPLVCVNLKGWKTLLENERIPYLLRNVKQEIRKLQ